MLGRNTILASTALVASMALAACNGDSKTFTEQEAPPPAGPLGLSLGEAVTVMSADANRNLVRVSDQHSTVTLNDLTFDAEGDIDTFSITFGLPDGSHVTIDEGDDWNLHGHVGMGDDGTGLMLKAVNGDDDDVRIIIGLGLDTEMSDSEEEVAGEALFALAAINRDDDHPLGYDTYMVSGEETGALPAEGTAVYKGLTIATLIKNGFGEEDHMTGKAKITAHFLPESVDVVLKGEGGDYDYELFANDLPMDGSQYGGEIEGTLGRDCFLCGDVDLAGDLLGAFYGDNAEATAGVFGAEGGSHFSDYELVGGYGAYVEDQDPVDD